MDSGKPKRRTRLAVIGGAAAVAVFLIWLVSTRSPTRTAIPGDVTAPGAGVEQREQGHRPPATMVASFDGLGVGFEGPHGGWTGRNPSDNSLAVGPDHIVQIVNTGS